MVRKLVRYNNRKLYDRSQSCYVTLTDIKQWIKDGDDVEIYSPDGKNWTREVLGQLLAALAPLMDEERLHDLIWEVA